MSVLTTATAQTHTGVLIRCLLDELAFIQSPLYTAVHTTDEIAAAVAATRVSITAWERASGLTRTRPVREPADEDDADVDVAVEPARAADSPDMAVAR